MARTTTAAATAKLEAKALAADSKSAGMRMLYDAGYSVTQVKDVFGVSYSFAYGVASRAGKSETAAARRAPRQATAKGTAKTAKPAVKATVAKVATARKVAVKATATKPLAKKLGRPTAARRQVNRKVAPPA